MLQNVFIFLNLTIIIFLLGINLSVVHLLPPPLNQTSMLFLSSAWLILSSKDSKNIGYLVFLFFLVEIFSHLPFGILSTALLGGTFIFYEIRTRFFSNDSWYSILIAAFAGTFFFRLFSAFLLFATKNNVFHVSFSFTEIIFWVGGAATTSMVLFLIHTAGSFLKNKLLTRYLPKKKLHLGI